MCRQCLWKESSLLAGLLPILQLCPTPRWGPFGCLDRISRGNGLGLMKLIFLLGSIV